MAGRLQRGKIIGFRSRVDHEDHADAHVEGLPAFIAFDFTGCAQLGKDVLLRHRCARHLGTQSFEHTGQVPWHTTTGDMRHRMQRFLLQERTQHIQVTKVWVQQHIGGTAGIAGEGIGISDLETLLDDATSEAVTIGMQSDGRHTDQLVAIFDAFAIDDEIPFDHADDGADQVELILRINTRHLCSLAAQQCDAMVGASIGHTGDSFRHHARIQLANPDVIEEEQWFRTLHEDVVDAVLHQATSDGVEAANRRSNPDLGADAIRRRHKDRLVAQSISSEQATETADICQHTVTMTSTDRLLGGIQGSFRRGDIHAGVTVAEGIGRGALAHPRRFYLLARIIPLPMTAPRRLVILGATGTVGVQALRILADTSSPVQVVALSCHRQAAKLATSGPEAAARFCTQDSAQQEALLAFLEAGDYEICLNAVVGAAGLPYTEAVLKAGRDLALANKESLVMAGSLLMPLAKRTGAAIIPVDSEHSAIHQCLTGSREGEIRRLYLTASGGALRDTPLAEMAEVTPAQALAHPNWDMGPRITIDSATMMNKAFEILEARFLFDVGPENIKVLVHRQSIVHSMVEFLDGSMLAQLGPPDMSLPIHYAVHHPGRFPSPLQGFDPQMFAQLTFEEPELLRFPCLHLGWRAAELGGDAGAILNGADEIAVQAFLDGFIPFPMIATLCAEAMDALAGHPIPDLASVYEADRKARDFVAARIPTAKLR